MASRWVLISAFSSCTYVNNGLLTLLCVCMYFEQALFNLVAMWEALWKPLLSLVSYLQVIARGRGFISDISWWISQLNHGCCLGYKLSRIYLYLYSEKTLGIISVVSTKLAVTGYMARVVTPIGVLWPFDCIDHDSCLPWSRSMQLNCMSQHLLGIGLWSGSVLGTIYSTIGN